MTYPEICRCARLLACAAILASAAAAETASSVTLTASPNPSNLGQAVTLTAAVTSGATGKVTFYDGTTVLGTGTISANQVTLTTVLLPSGARSLHAYYLGDSSYAPSTSAVVAQTVVAGASLGLKPPLSYVAGSGPQSIAVGDFNGDNKPDLVTTNTLGANVSVLLGNGDGTFQSAVTYPAGSDPVAIAIGDFNGDGKSDLAVANYGNKVSVLVGNGDGTFQSAVTYGVSAYYESIAVADFDGNGKPDLVVSGSDNVSILLGNGDGTFASAKSTAIAGFIAVGDFDGDGKPDLAATNIGQESVSILIGNGDGTFTPGTTDVIGYFVNPVQAADFNGDGKLDLIVGDAYEYSFSVLMGNGDGTFQSPVGYGTRSGSQTIAVADFDGDGKLDVAAGSDTVGGVTLLYGNGDGTFQSGVSYATGYTPVRIAIGDFNGDQKTDLATTVSGNTSALVFMGGALPDLSVSLSHGTGFTQGQTGATYKISISNVGQYATTSAVGVADTLPSSFGAMSISGDGWTCVRATLACTRSDALAPAATYPDISIKVEISDTLTGNATDTATVSGGGDQNASNNTAVDTTPVRLRTSITLTSTPNPSTLGQPVTLTAGITSAASGKMLYLDGTSILGEATISNGQAILTTELLSPGARSLTVEYVGDATYGPVISPVHSQTVNETSTNGVQPSNSYPVHSGPGYVAIGDFNRDGKLDLVSANPGGDVSVLLGNGDGTFLAAVNYPATSNLNTVVVADFNGDGDPDLAVAGYTGIFILLGNGDGSFQTAVQYGSGSTTTLIAADFNLDGIPDLATLVGSSLEIFTGKGDGTFASALTSSTIVASGVWAADFNGDGAPDLFFANSSSAAAAVELGNGDGTFQNPLSITVPFTGVNAFAVGDFNGDGKADIAATYWLGLETLLGNGDGTFQTPIQSSPSMTLAPGYYAVAGDFNADGKLDVAYMGYASTTFGIVFGSGNGTFSGSSRVPTPGSYAGNMAVGDFNGDGRPDYVVAVDALLNVVLGGESSGLSIAATHTGYFTAGQNGANYQIAIGNPAYASSASTVTVSDTLPSGITATAIGGSGWGCNLATLTCTRSDSLPTLSSYPPIDITVNVSGALSPSTITNHAAVSNNGIVNNATDPTLIVLPTTTTLNVSPSASVLGQAITMTAVTTTGATGRITFRDGATILGSAPIAGGQATFTTRLLPAGTCSLIAFYDGDSTHGTSSSTAKSFVVSAAPTSGFASALNAPTGSQPAGLAIGDFNGDGRTDVVTANSSASSVSVLLGLGDGGFAANVDYSVGTKPVSVAVGDFNGDGKQDLAVVNQTGNSLSILLGKGDGTFQSAVSYATGPGPVGVAIADFNGDGIADIAVSNVPDSTLSVFFGNGNGTFQSGKITTDFDGIASLTVGDFNADGKADLLTGASYSLVMLGNGDGTFSANYIGYDYGSNSAAGDLNGDGKTDFIVGNSNGVLVYLGTGTGSWQNPSLNYSLSVTPTALAIADVNGDGKLDVIALEANSFVVLLGNGDGTLQSGISYSLGSQPAAIVPAEFNGDGRTDLAMVNTSGNNVSVLLGVLTPVLSISSTHTGDFNFNATDTYSITVTNLGPGVTSGTITVVDTLPAGLTVSAISGSGWNCNSVTVTCTRSDSLGVGASYPVITLAVNVGASVTSPALNSVGVSGGGSVAATGTDSTIVNGGPPYPVLLWPPNTAAAIPLILTLQWDFSTGATSYDVYFGTSTPPPFVANVVDLSYYMLPKLAPDQVYYWQIVAKNAAGANPSPIWTFRSSVARIPTAAFRDANGSIRLSTYASSTLSNSGGVFASDPSAAQYYLNGNTFVTARDNSNSIWVNEYSQADASWSGWRFGGGITQGTPSITVNYDGTAWIASRDAYNSYWLVSYRTDNTFGAWIPLQGIFSTDPVITSCPGDGSIYVIGKDNYNSLWSGHYIPGSGFQGWVFGGGIVKGKPSATCGTDNVVYIAAEDNYNSNWIAQVSGNSWMAWYFGGAITSVPPRIASLGYGKLAVVILDSTGVVWRAAYLQGMGNNWQPWVQVGGILQDVAPAGAEGDLYLAGKAPNGDLWWWQQSGNQWTWIGNNGAAAGALSAAPR